MQLLTVIQFAGAAGCLIAQIIAGFTGHGTMENQFIFTGFQVIWGGAFVLVGYIQLRRIRKKLAEGKGVEPS